MIKCSRLFKVLPFVLILGLTACSSTKPTTEPAALTTPATTETTATTIAQATTTTTLAPETTTTLAPETSTTTLPQLAVSELEMNNLVARVEGLKTDVDKFGLGALLPEDYAKVDSSLAAIKEEYKTAMAEGFDGAKAFPIKTEFETSIADWESFTAKGIPLAAAAEKEKAADLRSKAMSADAPSLAQDRFAKAEDLLAQAEALLEKNDFAGAIPAYRYSASAYDDACEKAKVKGFHEKILSKGYAKYSDSYFQMGEHQNAEEEKLWKSGTSDDLTAGAAALRDANSYYAFVTAMGAEYQSFEEKDKAIESQNKALSIKADINCPDDYSSATDTMAEAFSNQEKGAYESASLWFANAATAYGTAYSASWNLKLKNEEAIAAAKDAIQQSEIRADEVFLGDNVYFSEAKKYLDKAEEQYKDQLFSDSTVNGTEVLNYSTLSDNFVVAEDARIEKETEERVASEKVLAEPAVVDARARMAWANDNSLKSDYPSQYKQASISMAAAELTYNNQRYRASQTLAEDVSSILSDDFQSKVLSARKAAEAEKASLSELALAKATILSRTDAAQTDARARMEWADDNNISPDYPNEYNTASTAIGDSFTAYGNEDYARATEKAKLVSSTLSDEFQAKVLAGRKAIRDAAVKLAADKAAADAALADARARMKWADDNNIVVDYADVYKDAKSSMSGAELSYLNEKYIPTKSLAEDVLVILSNDFQAKVLANRKAIRDAAAKLAADKAAADAALVDARARMKWADDNNISPEYPNEYKTASTAMNDSFSAYGKNYYPTATAKAQIVSSTLSDEFQAKVLANRKAIRDAAAKLAADKAAADAALADARVRMKWADDNRISPEYPNEYKTASTAMDYSSAAYGGKDYARATERAKLVSSTLSDEFQAKVLADRKAAAARLAAMPPNVRVEVKPERFSPDGDGEDDILSFSINTDAVSNIVDWKLEVFEIAIVESSKPDAQGQERLFIDWSGKGKPPSEIDWNGQSSRKELVESATDYPFKFVATNALGKSTTVTGRIAVDVLVLKDGNNLKLKVPSIVFRANNSDFGDLPADIIANNNKVLARIAQILNKYPNYKIKIQGNANSISKITGQSQAKIQAEEVNELIPLSAGRAKLVMTILIKNGVDAKRLSIEGLGSSQPVVSFLDAANRWKNRRVDFVLIKNK